MKIQVSLEVFLRSPELRKIESHVYVGMALILRRGWLFSVMPGRLRCYTDRRDN